jgi:hypothetical protein
VIHRFLEVADNLAIVDGGEAQVCGLQQRGIFPPQPVEPADIVFDVARLVPIAGLELPCKWNGLMSGVLTKKFGRKYSRTGYCVSSLR